MIVQKNALSGNVPDNLLNHLETISNSGHETSSQHRGHNHNYAKSSRNGSGDDGDNDSAYGIAYAGAEDRNSMQFLEAVYEASSAKERSSIYSRKN